MSVRKRKTASTESTGGPTSLPRTVALDDGDVELRAMRPADADAVLTFGRALPPHDLLFLPRDISHPKVLAAWVAEVERGSIVSVLAVRRGVVLGNVTIVSDPLSWSPFVAEIRLVILPEMRGRGLGRVLAETGVSIAIAGGAEKLVAQATVDQGAAIAVFEQQGYKAEALLRDHVRDREGVKHDIVMLSLDVAQSEARRAQYGLTEAEPSYNPFDL